MQSWDLMFSFQLFASSFASISWSEVPESHTSSWHPLSSTSQCCFSACWAEKSRDWERKVRESIRSCTSFMITVAERILLLKFWNTYFFFLWLSIHPIYCVVKELRQAWIEFCVSSLIRGVTYTNIRENSGTWKDIVLEPVVWMIYLVLATGWFCALRMLCSLGSIRIQVKFPF